MRVLVSGADGFIGRYVCKALRQAGHFVIGLDMYAGRAGAADEWILADITQTLRPIPNLDAVIHLAAVSHPRDCDQNPSKAFDVNVNGTSNVLRMVLASGAKKVVFSSSAHVYDIPPKYMPSGEVHPLRLNNVYTTTKILGEQLCDLYWTTHGLSYIVLRLFNAYGPGQAPGYFVPDMLRKQGDIDLGAGGHTTKDWVWVEDVARAFVLAVESPFVGAVNIGTGVETPLYAIAGRIARERGHICKTAPSDTASRMCADNGRAYRVLGWKPTKTIEEGLDAVLAAESQPVSA